MKKHKLRVRTIDELSLVDDPANQHSHAVFHKRNDRGEHTVKTRKSLAARLANFLKVGSNKSDEGTELEDVSKALAVSLQSTAEDTELTDEEKEEAIEKSLNAFTLAVLKKKPAAKEDDEDGADGEEDDEDDSGEDDEGDEDEGDDNSSDDEDAETKKANRKKAADCGPGEKMKKGKVQKSAEVIALEKRAEDAEKINKKLHDRVEAIEKANVRKALVTKATTMLGAVEYEGGAEGLADVIAGMPEEQIANLEKMFKKQNALIEASPLFEVLGSDAEGEEGFGGDAVEKINTRAAEIRKANKDLTDEQAQVQAMEELGDDAYLAAERDTRATR